MEWIKGIGWMAVGLVAMAAGYAGLWGADRLIVASGIGNPFAQEAFKRGLQFDTRTPLEFTSDAKATAPVYFVHALDGRIKVKGEPAVVFGGAANKRTYPCNEGGWPAFDSDDFGFTNPKGAWDRPELILLGDSFVEGMCQPEGQRIADYLRKRYRVLNLARAGAAPLSQLGILREYAPQNATILWFITDNDFKGLADELKSPILPKYLEPGFTQGLRGKQAWVNAVTRSEATRIIQRHEWIGTLPGIKLYRLLMSWSIRDAIDLRRIIYRPDPVSEVAEDFRKVLKAAGDVTMVYLHDHRKTGLSTHKYHIHQIARLAKLPLIDTTQKDGDPELLHQLGGHYSPLGNELVAESIIRGLDAPR